MKINELIKQLQAIKKTHGNIDCQVIGGFQSRLIPVKKTSLIYPIGPDGGYDRTQPATGVWISEV
jgi:hypothetical protein